MGSIRTGLGRTIRALRTAAGYSQEGFADAIGLHRTYMGTFERGAANPTVDTLERVAKGLGVTVWELLRTAELGRPELKPGVQVREGRRGRMAKRGGRRIAEPNNGDRR